MARRDVKRESPTFQYRKHILEQKLPHGMAKRGFATLPLRSKFNDEGSFIYSVAWHKAMIPSPNDPSPNNSTVPLPIFFYSPDEFLSRIFCAEDGLECSHLPPSVYKFVRCAARIFLEQPTITKLRILLLILRARELRDSPTQFCQCQFLRNFTVKRLSRIPTIVR